MILTALRGDHSLDSFPFTLMNSKDTPHIWKGLGSPYNFLFNAKARQPIETSWFKNGRGIVGHGRLATVGSISLENAHPFQEDDITLVHNGNISSGVDDFKDKDTVVDSHALTKAINELGVAEL